MQTDYITRLPLGEMEEIIRTAAAQMVLADADRMRVEEKAGTANFVTEYDVKIQRLLQAAFSALIPGMAVQKAVESLYEAGIPCGIVSVDDTCGVFGTKPDGDTFKIGLKDPRDTDAVFGYLTVNSGFIASAGDYLNASADSEKIHTVLDLSTGHPPETDLDSVTVYAANGAAASALSSALYVMGLDDALALYESDPAVLFEAVFVTESGEVIVTPGAADLFELNGEKYMLRSSGLE